MAAERLDWIESLTFRIVVEGIDHALNKKICEIFLDVKSGARPDTQQRYASIKFDNTNINKNLVEFIRENRTSFSDAYISIWGVGTVSWGEYFVPEAVIAFSQQFGLGIQVGFGVKNKGIYTHSQVPP